MTLVIDASVLIAAWLPGKSYRAQANALLHDFMQHQVELCAPSYMPAELLNGLYMAIRGKAGQPPRITSEKAQKAWAAFQQLKIPLHSTTDLAPRALELAISTNRPSTYDMVYAALAEHIQAKFLTGDLRLVRAVAEKLPWVISIEQYTRNGGEGQSLHMGRFSPR